MTENVNVFFVGTAGSGKTQLTHSFQLWMKQQGYDAITVNLDPGAEQIPYPADVDVRDWISLWDVIEKYGLGPNGAQIMCADMLGLKAVEIRETIEEFNTDYILIDTPGQMELFAYRESSRTAINILGKDNSIIVFLFDPFLSKDPLGFASLLMLSASVQFRFPLPFVNVLSKADMLDKETVDIILGWGRDIMELQDAISSLEGGMESENALGTLRALESLGSYSSLIPASSETYLGMEDIYSSVQQFFMGGEDLTR